MPQAQHFREIPKDRKGNVAYRKDTIKRCMTDKAAQQEELAKCREDILYWINAYVIQHNPKTDDPFEQEGPFITWDFQDAAIIGSEAAGYDPPDGVRIWGINECIDGQHDLVIEKSREMGASWLCLLVMDWRCRFLRTQKFLLISKDEDAVKGKSLDDMDGLLPKLDYVHDHLPDWMKGERKRTKMAVSYKSTRNHIVGAAQTARSGVGGRATAIFLDEFPQMEHARYIIGKTASTSDCRIANGTHLGTGTMFYEMTVDPLIRKLRIHWSLHPKKRRGLYRWDQPANRPEVLVPWSGMVKHGLGEVRFPEEYPFDSSGKPGGPYAGLRSPWYDHQCVRERSPAEVAQNQDMHAQGSVDQYFDPVALADMVRTIARDPAYVGEVDCDPDTAEAKGLYAVPTGNLRLWCRVDGWGRVPKGEYAVGCDLSIGRGTTNSVASIFSARREKVGEYVSPHLKPEEFAVRVVALCNLFRTAEDDPAYLVWEHNGPGVDFGKRVMELGFFNFYRRMDEANPVNPRPSDHPGWVNNNKTLPVLLRAYSSGLHRREIYNPCKESLEEAMQFKWDGDRIKHSRQGIKGGDPSGAGSNHGDRVIADGLADMGARRRYRGVGVGASIQEAAPAPTVIGSVKWRQEYRERQALTRQKLLSWC